LEISEKLPPQALNGCLLASTSLCSSTAFGQFGPFDADPPVSPQQILTALYSSPHYSPYGRALRAFPALARHGESEALRPLTLRHPASLRPGRTCHGPAFGRFDEITDLVAKTPDLTLPESRARALSIALPLPVAMRHYSLPRRPSWLPAIAEPPCGVCHHLPLDGGGRPSLAATVEFRFVPTSDGRDRLFRSSAIAATTSCDRRDYSGRFILRRNAFKRGSASMFLSSGSPLTVYRPGSFCAYARSSHLSASSGSPRNA
jgi:hypothetical protein